jgi:Eco57I restriction-modification methylase
VRQETIKPFKPYLERHYNSHHSSLDLYGYFYELALRICKNDGRIGYISSYSFLKTSSAKSLRMFLISHGNLESFIDFGDIKVLEDVTTYPVILTAKKIDSDFHGRIRGVSRPKFNVGPTDQAFPDWR